LNTTKIGDTKEHEELKEGGTQVDNLLCHQRFTQISGYAK